MAENHLLEVQNRLDSCGAEAQACARLLLKSNFQV
jgi:hypothetical protein